jgi:hypothetical protein
MITVNEYAGDLKDWLDLQLCCQQGMASCRKRYLKSEAKLFPLFLCEVGCALHIEIRIGNDGTVPNRAMSFSVWNCTNEVQVLLEWKHFNAFDAWLKKR